MKLAPILVTLGFNLKDIDLVTAFEMYMKPNRFYHNEDHVFGMLQLVEEWSSLPRDEYTALVIAILFHDIVYEPGSKTNEEESWRLCEYICLKQNQYVHLLPMIRQMILATKIHEYRDDLPEYVKLIIRADLNGFCLTDFKVVWRNNVNIFKEFQKFDWPLFQEGQRDFLMGLRDRIKMWMPPIAIENIDKILSALEVWEPKIAIYPGSFNPFHVGHLNILEKAERIFDKVIISRGNNPDKNPSKIQDITLLNRINNRQIEDFEGLLTDYVASKQYPVTIIRGLRNTTDMAYEQNTYRWLQDLNPEVNVVSLFCDKEYEHVSSSGIRLMEKFNKQEKYLLK